VIAGTEGYEEDAERLVERYDSTPFVEKHRAVLDLLPTRPGRVLDIGAGTGSDAAWLADQGHTVLAVEPIEAFRRAAAIRHPCPASSGSQTVCPGFARRRADAIPSIS